MGLEFTNNSAAALASAANTSDVVLTLDDAGRFATPAVGAHQVLTLVSASDAGVFEIVHMTGRAGNALTVVRGREGTTPKAWPGGAKVEARITAGTLEAFLQGVPADFMAQGADGVYRTAGGKFVVNGANRLPVQACQIAGMPLMSLMRGAPNAAYNAFDMNLGREVMGTTGLVEIGHGDYGAWAANVYTHAGHVIINPAYPTTQYWFESATGIESGSAVQPDYANTTSPTIVMQGGVVKGAWIPSPFPVDTTITVPGAGKVALMLSEVGFISKESDSYNGTISIGTAADPKIFVSDKNLGVIPLDVNGFGALHAARFPLPNSPFVTSLRFTASAPDPGMYSSTCLGRFYWRGTFVEVW